MPRSQPITLVVATHERQLGVRLRVEDAARYPLVVIAGVHLWPQPPGERLGAPDRQPPDVSGRALNESAVLPEMLEQDLGASLERLAVFVVDPDLAVRDATLGDEEAEQPRDILVDPHAGARWHLDQREPVADVQVARRPHVVAGRPGDHDRMLTGDVDNPGARDEPEHTIAFTQRMARQVNDLRPAAIGPDGHGMTAHVPDRRSVLEEATAQIPRRLVAPQLADVADVDQTAAIIAKEHRRVTPDAVIKRARAHDVHAVALEVLPPHEVLGDLAHRVGRERAERVRLEDRQLVGIHEPVLLARADHEEARRRPELAHGLEQVHLADDVRVEGLDRLLPRGRDEALRREVDDDVRPRLGEDVADREHVPQVRLDQRHPAAEVLDVLGLAAPAERADDLRTLRQRPLREVAADEPADARDEDAHSAHTTTGGPRSPSRPGTAERPADARRQGQGEPGPQGEERAPGRVRPAPHGPPAQPSLGAEPIVVAHRRDASRQEPAHDEGLGKVRETRDAAQAHPEVVVLRDRQRLVVAADAEDGLPPQHHGGVHERVPSDQRPADRGVVRRRNHDGHLTPGRVHLARPRTEQPDGGMRVEEGALARDALGHGQVVGVEPRHQRAAREAEGAVERAREPEARLALDPEARVADAREDLGRRVGRAVVDHDQLEVARRLREDAPDGVRDPRRAVVHGHQHRDRGDAHRSAGASEDFWTRRFRYGSASDGGRPAAASAPHATAKSGRSDRRVGERAVSRKKRQP